MTHVICNPTACNGKALHIAEAVVQRLREKGVGHELLTTQGKGHATELAAKAAQSGAEAVLAVGGDGTLHELAQGLLNTRTALGIIPAGTGNDFVKTARIPLDPMKALDAFLTLTPRPTDTVRINGQIFLNEAGAGFDVMVLDYAEHAKQFVKGLLPYLYGVIRTIFHYQSVRVKVSADGAEPAEKELLVVGAGNGRFIGGGIPIAPEAAVDDGLIDVVLVDGMRKGRMLRALPALLKGRILSFPETSFTRVKKLVLEKPGLRVNVDGEILTMDRAEMEILPGSLLVYRP